MEYPKIQKGLTRELIVHISESKGEPVWMKEKRLSAFELYEKAELPKWGPGAS